MSTKVFIKYVTQGKPPTIKLCMNKKGCVKLTNQQSLTTIVYMDQTTIPDPLLMQDNKIQNYSVTMHTYGSPD